MRNAPKRNAKCTKTQGEMHQNAMQNAPKQQAFCNNMQYTKGHKTLSADWNNVQKEAKWYLKDYRFGAKCRKIGRHFLRASDNLEGQNGAKRRSDHHILTENGARKTTNGG